VFGPSLNQVTRQPVPSPVASPGRGRVDARRWRKTTSWDAGCRTRVRLGQNLCQGHRNHNPKKDFLDNVTFGFGIRFFVIAVGASTPTDNVSLHRTGDPPAGFPGVRAMQRPWPRPTAGSKESGSDTGQKRHHNKYMFSASVLATKGPGRRRAYAHWTEGDPLPRRRRRSMPDTSATNYFRWTARKATGQEREPLGREPGACNQGLK